MWDKILGRAQKWKFIKIYGTRREKGGSWYIVGLKDQWDAKTVKEMSNVFAGRGESYGMEILKVEVAEQLRNLFLENHKGAGKTCWGRERGGRKGEREKCWMQSEKE